MFIWKNAAVAFGIALATFFASPAFAYDWSVQAHIVEVEPSYMPSQVIFALDTAGGSCAAGTFLSWNITGGDEASKAANASGVLSALLTALVAQRTVTVFGYNSGCTVSYIHIQ